MKPKILILTSNTGGGHQNLALSLQDNLSKKYDVVILDPSPQFVIDTYRLTSRYIVGIRNSGYEYYDDAQKAMFIHKLAKWFIYESLTDSIKRINPDLVITTHGVLSLVVADSLRRFQRHIPLVFQLTDTIKIPEVWLTEKNADAYLAPSPEIVKQVLASNISEKLIYLTGRPVRRQFLQDYQQNREEIFNSLNLNSSKFTLFLQSGADGVSGILSVLQIILDIGENIQVILAAGTNKKLLSATKRKNLFILPFTQNIAQYMAISNLIVGKAGASFVFEAIALEKPFVATSYFSGQESPTLTFIEKHNLGWICTDPAMQREFFETLINRPSMLEEKAECIRNYKKWNLEAQSQVSEIIDNLISKNMPVK